MIVKLPVYETVVISSLASFSISLMDFVACAPLSLQQSLLLKIQVVSTFRLWVNQSNDEATTVDPVSIPSTLPMGNSPCNWEQIMNMRNKGVMANLLRVSPVSCTCIRGNYGDNHTQRTLDHMGCRMSFQGNSTLKRQTTFKKCIERYFKDWDPSLLITYASVLSDCKHFSVLRRFWHCFSLQPSPMMNCPPDTPVLRVVI